MDAVSFLAFYDLWKSAEMSHAPHTPLKHRFKQWMAPKLGLAIPDDPTEDQNVSGYNGSENLYYNGDLVHAGAATNQIPGIKALIALTRIPARSIPLCLLADETSIFLEFHSF